jgi:hypothetical protein
MASKRPIEETIVRSDFAALVTEVKGRIQVAQTRAMLAVRVQPPVAQFTEARKLGTMADRVHRELLDADIAKIAGTYHVLRGDKDEGEYAEDDGEPNEETVTRITAQLREQQAEAAKLDAAIAANLKELGYGG